MLVVVQALREQELTSSRTLFVFVSEAGFDDEAERYGVTKGGRIGLKIWYVAAFGRCALTAALTD